MRALRPGLLRAGFTFSRRSRPSPTSWATRSARRRTASVRPSRAARRVLLLVHQCQLDRVPTQSPACWRRRRSRRPRRHPCRCRRRRPYRRPCPCLRLPGTATDGAGADADASLRPTPRRRPASPRPTAGTLRPTYSQEPSPAPTPMPTRAPIPADARPDAAPHAGAVVEPTRAPTTAAPPATHAAAPPEPALCGQPDSAASSRPLGAAPTPRAAVARADDGGAHRRGDPRLRPAGRRVL